MPACSSSACRLTRSPHAAFVHGRYSAAETITTPSLRRSLVALPALRDFDVWAAIKADKLDRLEAWINVSSDPSHNVPSHSIANA